MSFPKGYDLEDVKVTPIGGEKFVAVGRNKAGGWMSLRVKHGSSDSTVTFPDSAILLWLCEQNRRTVIEWVRKNATLTELLGRPRATYPRDAIDL